MTFDELWQHFVYIGTLSWLRIGETDITLFRLLGLIFMLLFFWWFSAALEKTLQGIVRRSSMAQRAGSGVFALTRIVRYLVWILGSLVGLAYVGIDLASLAIVGGAVGVGLGFGLQTIFSNLISGIILLLEKTLKVGDFVDLQSGVFGRVKEIGLRYTRVATNDNVDIIVPNSEFINNRVINWTLDDHFRRMHIPFGVAYGADKDAVRDAVIAAALTVSGTVNEENRRPDVWLVGFGDSSLNFELVVWAGQELVTYPGRTTARYLWAIETALSEAGIEIPFPQRDLHVRSGSLKVQIEKAGE